MATREYPRKSNEYPEIMSKLDPLIIRVSPTVLLVGSTSYTAKVKLGTMFNGYYVNVSGVGLPILKQEVDISGHSNTNGTGNKGENSDAWNYIISQAEAWMDTLEQSMLSNNSSKNIVDLLREIKFQNHFDLSGHTDMIEPYKDSVEVCTEEPTYPQSILAQLTSLNTNLTTLNQHMTNMEQRMVAMEEKIDNITPALTALTNRIGSEGTTIEGTIQSTGTEIATAIENGLTSLVGQMNTMNTNITTVGTDVLKVYSSVGPAAASSPTSIRALLDGWIPNINTINTINGTVNTINSNVSSVKSTVEAIRTVDVPDIKNTISSSSSSGAVSDLSGTVNSMFNVVNSIYGKVDYVDDIDVDRVNRMVLWLGDTDNKAEYLSYAIHEDNGDHYVDAKILGN